MHGVDAAEIVGIQYVLPARPGGRLLADLLLQHPHHRVQHVHHLHIQPLAGRVELAAQRLFDQGGEHRAGLASIPSSTRWSWNRVRIRLQR